MKNPEQTNFPIDKNALLEFTQRLVRCQSWNPPGDEAQVAKIVAEQMRVFGMEVVLSPVAPGRDKSLT